MQLSHYSFHFDGELSTFARNEIVKIFLNAKTVTKAS